MVHADASTFKPEQTKQEVYSQILDRARALLEGQRNWFANYRQLWDGRTKSLQVCNLSNVSALLYHALRSLPMPSSEVNWCGFYIADPLDSGQLILGPFQGHVACQTIKLGRGVCGTAAATGKTQLVPDVEKFPGHIACDANSRSEIVVPIVQADKVVAIIDIDCAQYQGFDGEDLKYLEVLALLIADSCDF